MKCFDIYWLYLWNDEKKIAREICLSDFNNIQIVGTWSTVNILNSLSFPSQSNIEHTSRFDAIIGFQKIEFVASLKIGREPIEMMNVKVDENTFGSCPNLIMSHYFDHHSIISRLSFGR